jgi:tellurite resistance protein
MKAATVKIRLPLLPASFFALTLGLAETGNAWRFAAHAWQLPAAAGEALQALAVLSFLVFIALYAHKWLAYRDAAAGEVPRPGAIGLPGTDP